MIYVFDLGENRLWQHQFTSKGAAIKWLTQKQFQLLRSHQQFLLLKIVGEVTPRTYPAAYSSRVR